MFSHISTQVFKNPALHKLVTFSLVLFFVFLSDGILSFWVPNLLEDSLKSSLAMGLIMSFSSVIGFGADLIFPQIIKGITVRKLILLGILTNLLFIISLYTGTFVPLMAIFLTAMAIWGLYYEFLGFSSQQFVADSIPYKLHSSAWAILGVFKNLAYFLGPLMASWLLLRGEVIPSFLAIVFTLIGFLILLASRKVHDRPMEIDIKDVNLIKEIEHWVVLFEHVWPVVILSLFLGIIDATFWTVGAVWTESLTKQSFWGGFFLPFYTLPFLFSGLIIAKKHLYQGKGKLAEIFLLLGGVFLSGLAVSALVYWQLILTLIASTMLSFAYPLTDGIYSDIVSRMGRERRHMIGLSASTKSLAYIVGPILAGLSSRLIGERLTFGVVGITSMIISIGLLILSPKRFSLPQKEIKKWE